MIHHIKDLFREYFATIVRYLGAAMSCQDVERDLAALRGALAVRGGRLLLTEVEQPAADAALSFRPAAQYCAVPLETLR